MKHFKMCAVLSAVILAFWGLVVGSPSVSAYDVTRLTDNSVEERGLDVALGRAVWQARTKENGTYEVVYWDGKNLPVTITDNDVQDLNPRITRAGAVWYSPSGTNGSEEIWVWESATGAARQVTQNLWDDKLPRSGGDWITWQGQSGLGSTWEIYLYRNGAIERLTINSYRDETPVTDGHLVAWIGYPPEGGTSQVFVWDGVQTVVISDPSLNSRNPTIHQGWVAWEASSGGEDTSEVFVWDGAEVQRLTSNSVFDGYASLWSPWVGWEADHLQVGYPPEVRARNMETGAVFETSNVHSDFNLVTGPETISWLAHIGPYLYNFPTTEVQIWDGAETVRVTNNGFNERGLIGDDRALGWLGEAGPLYSSEVFVLVLKALSPAEPIVLEIEVGSLEWSSVVGRTYLLQRKARLGGDWVEEARYVAEADTIRHDISGLANEPSAFFRVLDVSE